MGAEWAITPDGTGLSPLDQEYYAAMPQYATLMYGTNDLPNYLATFFGGIPSKETLPLYMARSAMTYADKVTTPTLILHGGSDERVPIGQPMEFYRALKEHGTPVELVFYPRQGHGLQEYYHQRDRLQRQYDWISRFTLGDSGRKTTSQ